MPNSIPADHLQQTHTILYKNKQTKCTLSVLDMSERYSDTLYSLTGVRHVVHVGGAIKLLLQQSFKKAGLVVTA